MTRQSAALKLSTYVFRFILICIFGVGFGRSSFAALTPEQQVQALKGMQLVQAGKYLSASEVLGALPQNDSRTLYFLGLSLHALHQNVRAQTILTTAAGLEAKTGIRNPHLHYLLGEVLYEQKKFIEAADAFTASARAEHMVSQSLFFAAYCQQVAGKLPAANKLYEELLGRKDAAPALRQAALFQAGEILYAYRGRISIRDEILPVFERALREDEDSELANQIRARFAKLREESKIYDAKFAASGGVPRHAFVFRFAQNFKYDTNVLYEPDDRIFKVSNHASPLSVTSLFGRAELRSVLSSVTFVIAPELAFDATYHANRGNFDIFANDNLSIVPALRTRAEHAWRFHNRSVSWPAAALLDLEFGYNTRDYRSEHAQLFFSRYFNPVVGYRLLVPGVGVSQIKANIKLNENVNHSLSYFAPGVTASQTFLLGRDSHALNFSLGMEQQWSNLRFYSQKNYRMGAGYSVPPVYWSTALDLTLQFTLIDTLNQLEERGYEKEISPSLNLTHYFQRSTGLLSHLALQGGYTYLSRSSKDREAYAYSKHLISMGVMLTL